MILQSTDSLEEYIGNKYSLVIVAAKRARQLKEGHEPLARDASDNKLSIALTEIQEEKLQAIAPPEEELAPAPRDVIASLVAGADFDMDEELDLDESDAVDDLAALLVGGGDDDDEEEAAPDDDVLVPQTGSGDDDDTGDDDTEDDDEPVEDDVEDTEDEDAEE